MIRCLTFILLLVSMLGCADPYSQYEQVAVWQGDRGRIYSVYSPDENWAAMEKFARTKVVSKNRVTQVLFFSKREYAPDKEALEAGEMAPKAKRYWVAQYERLASGRETFVQYPGRKRQ